MLLASLFIASQLDKPYETPLLGFANEKKASQNGKSAWQSETFPFERKELPIQGNRTTNIQVVWDLKGTNLQVVCPTNIDPIQVGPTIAWADDRADDVDSADNKLGACRYGCIATTDPKTLAWYQTLDKTNPRPAQQLARYWGITKEFAAAKLIDGEYRFTFDGSKTDRLGNTQTVPWIGKLRIRENHGWVTASFVERREEETVSPAEDFWRSSLLQSSPDAGNAAKPAHPETLVRPRR